MGRQLMMAAGLVAVLGIGACSQETDVEKMATTALDQAALSDVVDAKYDRDARVVHLSGSVARPEDRIRADDAVRASVEGLALVANEIVVEGEEADAADDMDGAIEERFGTLWSNTPSLNRYDIDLTVENGVVTLSGDVATAAERAEIEGMVTSIPGVVNVVNGIAVKPDARPVTPSVPPQ